MSQARDKLRSGAHNNAQPPKALSTLTFMFNQASAFDQDLGWCLDRGVNTWRMFEGAGCTLRSYNPGYFHCNVRVRVLGSFGDCVLV